MIKRNALGRSLRRWCAVWIALDRTAFVDRRIEFVGQARCIFRRHRGRRSRRRRGWNPRSRRRPHRLDHSSLEGGP